MVWEPTTALMFVVVGTSMGSRNDQIYPNAYSHRDFSYDFIDCGPDAGDRLYRFYSSDGETASNCENVQDIDR